MGMQNAIGMDDSVITAYRCHGWTYMRGVSTAGVLAELTGIKVKPLNQPPSPILCCCDCVQDMYWQIGQVLMNNCWLDVLFQTHIHVQ